MEKNKLSMQIAEIFDKYPLEKYPNSLGFYLENNGKLRIGYIYENEDGLWVNNLNDKIYHSFEPLEIVYSCFAEGYTPFFVSDFIHLNCWFETTKSLSDLDDIVFDKYYHGKKAYFSYCKNNGINKGYIKNLETANSYYDIHNADEKFWKFDTQLQVAITDILKDNDSLDPVTLRSYEYLLNEPYYNDLIPLYTLKITENNVSYFSYDDHYSIVGITDYEVPKTLDLMDWAYNDEEFLFNELYNGATIIYMSLESHENILYALSLIDKNELEEQTCTGIRNYLDYVKTNRINSLLSKRNQDYFNKACKDYKLPEIVKCQNTSKNKRGMER